ncbi:MAG: hypothetical protein ACT4PG_06720 [Panacagrimonas sp.]
MDMNGWIQVLMVLAVIAAMALIWARYRRPASIAVRRHRVRIPSQVGH